MKNMHLRKRAADIPGRRGLKAWQRLPIGSADMLPARYPLAARVIERNHIAPIDEESVQRANSGDKILARLGPEQFIDHSVDIGIGDAGVISRTARLTADASIIEELFVAGR